MNEIKRLILKSLFSGKLRTVYSDFINKLLHTLKIYTNRDDILNFWKNLTEDNQPDQYLEGKERSLFLVKVIKEYCMKNVKILEIGCNVGRNLFYLYQNGFHKLSAIEPNSNAIKLLKNKFPQLSKSVKIYNNPAEEVMTKIEDSTFGVIFTMAVLEHIHPESDWLFAEIARVSKQYVITIENEKHYHWQSFVRNYKKIFEDLGLTQIKEIQCSNIPGLGKLTLQEYL